MTEAGERGRGIGRAAVVVGIVLLVAAYPILQMGRGYAFARDAAQHGVSVDLQPQLDGIGFGARASAASARHEVAFDAAYYDRLAGGSVHDELPGEGVPYFFFALGSRLGRAD